MKRYRQFKFQIAAVAIVLMSVGCAQAPTKIFTTQNIDTLFLEKELQRPIKINAKTIFVDARSNFQYALLHAPQSVHVDRTDFTKTSKSTVLKNDLKREVQRLALLGITPTSNVVVLSGRSGKSWIDAGYVAWALMYVGVRSVQLVDMHSLHIRYYNVTPPPRPNAPMWKPNFDRSMVATRAEIKKFAAKFNGRQLHLLDTRSRDDFSFRWRPFFNKDDRPSLEMKRKLNARGIKGGDRIIVLSSRGLRSAAVAYALLAMGFRNVGTLPGGYYELLNRVSH